MVKKIVHERMRIFTDKPVEKPYAEFKQWHQTPEKVEVQIIESQIRDFPIAIVTVGEDVWHVSLAEGIFGCAYLIEYQGCKRLPDTA